MKQVNDLYQYLSYYLSTEAIVSQCIIKDYVVSEEEGKEGLAFCTVVLPNANDGSVTEITNVNCFMGSAVDITYQDYMHGIFIKLQAPYTKAQDISAQTPISKYDYFHLAVDGHIAIIFPHTETLSNILTAKLSAQNRIDIASEFIAVNANQIYLGNQETNVLNELSEYLTQLKDFFDKLSQYAPTISQLPADGSAKIVALATQLSTSTQEVYDKITKIVNTELSEDKNE